MQSLTNKLVVLQYTSSKLKFSQIDAFGLIGTESIRLKIWKNDSTKASVIASIYRHPSENIKLPICYVSDCLKKLSNEKKPLTFLVTYTLTLSEPTSYPLKMNNTYKQ